jgi:hypothetical protein
MTYSAPPPQGLPSVALPNFGTVPLGPDEPELFADAMARILDHLLFGDDTGGPARG